MTQHTQHTQYSLHDIKKVDGEFYIPDKKRPIIASEIKRCTYDKAYFLGKYITTDNPFSGRAKFMLNRAQHKILSNSKTHKMNMCVSPRQVGGTTLLAGLCLHDLIFKSNHKTLYVAYKQVAGYDFVSKVKAMIDNVPKILLSEIKSTKGELRVGNNQLFSSSTNSIGLGKGMAVSNIIMDNIYAKTPEQFSDICASLIPCIMTSSYGTVFFLHTPTDNFFKVYRPFIKSKLFNKFNITIDDVEKFDDHKKREEMEEEYDYWYDEYDYLWRFK